MPNFLTSGKRIQTSFTPASIVTTLNESENRGTHATDYNSRTINFKYDGYIENEAAKLLLLLN